MRRWAWAVALLVVFTGCRKEPDTQPLPPQEPIAGSPEWSLQKFVEAIDALRWEGDWVSAMLPSRFGEGPAVTASLTYRWRERELVLEFLAYERYESLKDLPAEEACRKIARWVREQLSKDPLHGILERTLETLPGPPHGTGTAPDADSGPESRACLTVIQVTVQANAGDQPPYQELSSCRESLPASSSMSGERTVHYLPERSPTL